jgi:hypothetical protein
MKPSIFLLAIAIACAACNNKTPDTTVTDTTAATTKDTASSTTYIPVTSFLKGQLLILDSLPVTVLQTITTNNHTDSVWIKKEQVHTILAPFINTIIDEKLAAFFKQTKFNDQTIDAITYTHDATAALPDSVSIKHWDIYVNPETGKIKKVYIVKQLQQNGSHYTQQLTWQTDHWARMVTILHNPGGKSQLQSDTKLVWNFNDTP